MYVNNTHTRKNPQFRDYNCFVLENQLYKVFQTKATEM